MRSSVDLPHPEGPTSTQNSPSAMSTSTPRITWVDPKYFCTAEMPTAAIGVLLAPCGLGRCAGAYARGIGVSGCRTGGPARAAGDHVVRPPRGVPRHEILRRLAPQFLLCRNREERRVRRQDHPRMTDQRRIARHRLGRQHVEGESRQRAAIDRSQRGVDVDDRAARRVDEKRRRAPSSPAARAPIMPRVSSLSGVCSETTSAWANRSARLARSTYAGKSPSMI